MSQVFTSGGQSIGAFLLLIWNFLLSSVLVDPGSGGLIVPLAHPQAALPQFSPFGGWYLCSPSAGCLYAKVMLDSDDQGFPFSAFFVGSGTT